MPSEAIPTGSCIRCPKCLGNAYNAQACICWRELDETGQGGQTPIGTLTLPLYPPLAADEWCSDLLPEARRE